MDKEFLSKEVFLTEINYIKLAISDLKAESRHIPSVNMKLNDLEKRIDQLCEDYKTTKEETSILKRDRYWIFSFLTILWAIFKIWLDNKLGK